MSDDVIEIGKEELERRRQAYEMYMQTGLIEPAFSPPEWVEPVYKEPEFRDTFGLVSITMWMAVVGSILVSAITVGLILFISAVNTEALLIQIENVPPFVQALVNLAPMLFLIAGTFAFEGYAVSHGLAEGLRLKQVTFSNAALIAAFTVMISSGVLRSFALQAGAEGTTLYQFVLSIVILSTGVGAPVVVRYGSQNISVFKNQFEELKSTSKQRFDEDTATARTKYQELYDRLHDEFLIRSEKHQKAFQAWYAKNAILIFGVDRKPETPTTRKKKEEVAEGIAESVREWLAQNNLTAHDIGTEQGNLATPKDIADALGIRDSGAVRTTLSRLRTGK